jgi:hypothetical protein
MTRYVVDGATNPPFIEEPSQVVDVLGHFPLQLLTSPPVASRTSMDQESMCARAEFASIFIITGL